MQFSVLLCEMYFMFGSVLFLKGTFDTYTVVVCNSSVKNQTNIFVSNEHQKPVKQRHE